MARCILSDDGMVSAYGKVQKFEAEIETFKDEDRVFKLAKMFGLNMDKIAATDLNKEATI